MLKSNLSDYNDAYILVRGDITIIGHNVTQVVLKNLALFITCIRKIDQTRIDDAEDLDLVMPMDNLLKYSSNYSGTTDSLWFYSKDEATNFDADIADSDNFKSFSYKAKFFGNTVADGVNGILRKITTAVSLKVN